MPPRTSATRERILEVAHRVVLERGFAAASLDRILGEAGVTKGAFFHHFRSKADLAEALAQRYAAAEAQAVDALFQRAAALSDDPLQRVLLVVGLLAESIDGMQAGDPGCLLASFIYEKDMVTPGVLHALRGAIDRWRERFGAAIAEAIAAHPPRVPVDPAVLADHANVIVEGAFILARTTGAPGTVTLHLKEFRRHVELLFEAPTSAGGKAPRRKAQRSTVTSPARSTRTSKRSPP